MSPRSLCAAALAAALLAAGCAVGPDYRRPAVTTPAAFAEHPPWREAAPKDALPKAGWWRVYGDAELDRLETEGQAGNLSLQAALARFDQARALARISRADFFPALSVDPSAARERFSGNRELSPGSADFPYTTNSIDLPLDLQYQIDLFGRVRRAYESARDLAQAQWADTQNVLLGMQAEVAQDYFTLRSLRSQRDLLVRTLDLRRQALGLVQTRRAGGASSDLDVYQARTELELVRSQVLATDRASAGLRHALAVLLGRPPEDFALDPGPLQSAPPAVPVGMPSDLLERRPDVSAAERNLAAASARIGFAKAAFFPSIGLTAEAGLNSTAFNTLLRADSQEWSVGPYLSLPVFEGGANLAAYREAKASYAEQWALYRGQVLAAFQDVDDGLSDLRYLAAQAEAVGLAADSARRASNLSMVRYRQGVTDYFEVIDAERTEVESELEAAQIQGARFVASVRLVKALGGGW